MVEALDIQVKGIVQGVGFRPFVYRLAKKYLVNGWVLNATDGVFIHAEAESKLLDEFVIELSENPPAASQVDEITLKEVALEDFDSFEIRFSDGGAVEKTTLVSPDLATCADCADELFNPNDRRFRYPFINCTNCGPRFTIIEQLPYDRKSTSMKDFPMCERCANEYGDPLDRRFHAQPDACFECGPHLSWREHEGLPGAPGEVASETFETFKMQTNVSRETMGADDVAPDSVGVSVDVAGTAAGVPAAVAGTAAGTAAVAGAIDAPLGPATWGATRQESDAILARAVELLLAGKILAVKGLGGFHLVCDANNAEAVAALRARKRREGKAFAVMMRDADAVRDVCHVSEAEEGVLASTQRPIVLLRKRADAAFAPKLADDLPELGVMLPYTPLQHLLLHDFAEAHASRAHADAPAMLVMTSGNVHDEPIVTDDQEAYDKLSGIADAFLGNNRAIRARYDDSVVRVIQAGSAGDAVQFIRRARGYAPLPIALPSVSQSLGCANATESLADVGGSASDQNVSRETSVRGESPDEAADETLSILAAGPEQKNAFTLTRDAEAFVSQHIGDMENAETYDAWLQAKDRYARLFEIAPNRLACDLHPEYLTTKWAVEESRARNLPLVQVQHHHAHIVSVMGEHGLAGPVCGISFDGTGYGADGAIWGGEVLLSNLRAFERFANFAYVPMPGGAAAVKHPLRMAYGALWAFDLLEHPGAAEALAALGPQAQVCDQMIEQGINTPMTSSVGRLFDAASALLGICSEPAYEGEPAILLEAAITRPDHSAPALPDCAADAAAPTQTNVSRETWVEENHQGANAENAEHAENVVADDAEAAARYAIEVLKNTATETSTAQDTSVLLFDAAPTFKALLNDKAAGVPTPVIARRFHDAFVQAILTAAELVRSVYGIDVVALSGGVFMNRYLVEHALAALESAGFTVAVNRDLPPNDGCISFGQAVVAWASNNDEAPAADQAEAERPERS